MTAWRLWRAPERSSSRHRKRAAGTATTAKHRRRPPSGSTGRCSASSPRPAGNSRKISYARAKSDWCSGVSTPGVSRSSSSMSPGRGPGRICPTRSHGLSNQPTFGSPSIAYMERMRRSSGCRRWWRRAVAREPQTTIRAWRIWRVTDRPSSGASPWQRISPHTRGGTCPGQPASAALSWPLRQARARLFSQDCLHVGPACHWSPARSPNGNPRAKGTWGRR
ncbi:hypothetical protein MetexDRAFT_1472 [Methylorubrum extorquens DSM 13060]|uniref:Uncharacterized protein n=1 Tax=Methylorubrum extorquens DSM 13060 TaxID=882800 RepID=H1KFR0_METEX|nr:hypothetical protein MetexDRAFT_1472 [Methylorubrum extorquens DSM 13060]